MKAHRRLLVGIVGAGMAIAGTVASAPAANAATATCGAAGYYCFFVRQNWYYPGSTGWRIRFASTTFDNFSNYPAAEGPTGTFLDNVESMANTGSKSICVFNNGVRIYKHAPGVDVSSYFSNNNTFDYWKTSPAAYC